MKKIFIAAFVAFSFINAEAQTIEEVNAIEFQTRTIKEDANVLIIESADATIDTYVIERIKKGTNMLLPSICAIVENPSGSNNPELISLISELLTLVSDMDKEVAKLEVIVLAINASVGHEATHVPQEMAVSGHELTHVVQQSQSIVGHEAAHVVQQRLAHEAAHVVQQKSVQAHELTHVIQQRM